MVTTTAGTNAAPDWSALRSSVAYATSLGQQLVGDSRELLARLPAESIDLIVTSPPFALLREKSYGNKDQTEYVRWLCEFGSAALPVLRETGSFVVDLGGSYQRGKPVRSLCQWRVLLDFCDTLGYRLAEEFYWHNPAKLPSPIEWVNKRKIRAKDSVNTVWWFSKSDWPKADVTKVLAPYSDRMKKIIADPESFYRPKSRPSGHKVSRAFGNDNGGAIPPNLITAPNTESNSSYLRACKLLEKDSHPARFPSDLPAFFIKMEERRDYAALSIVRFLDADDASSLRASVEQIERGKALEIVSTQREPLPRPTELPGGV